MLSFVMDETLHASWLSRLLDESLRPFADAVLAESSLPQPQVQRFLLITVNIRVVHVIKA